jgi:hypothetical protein
MACNELLEACKSHNVKARDGSTFTIVVSVLSSLGVAGIVQVAF